MKRLITLVVAVGALVLPAGAFASTGIVLKVERGAHLIAVAHSSHVRLIHTSHRGLAVGERVSMQARTLRNGTFAASKLRVTGRARHVTFRGLVLARSAAQHRITLSAGGAIVTVKSNDHPKTGSEVEVDADVGDNGDLDNGQTQTVDQTAPGGSIEGHVVALLPGSITIASEHELLVLSVPSTIDVSKLAIGDEVLANFAQQTDGSLTLTSFSADDSVTAAEQGDHGDNGDDGHDGGGDNGGSGDDGGSGDNGGGGND
jgi:uncharacterized membrane protein YgcG